MLHRWLAVLQLFLTAFTFAWAGPVQAQSTSQNDDSDSGLDALPAEERGDLLMLRHAYVEATYAYSLAPVNAVVWNKMGIAYHHLLAIGEARSDYEKALRLQPDYADAMNNLGATYFAEGNYRKAIGLYMRALRLTPASAVFTANLGTAYFAQGKEKQGADAYRSAFKLDPNIFDLNSAQIIQGPTNRQERARLDFCLAELYASSKNNERALDYLHQALSAGYLDRKRLMDAPAFADLRTTPEFTEFLAEFASR